MKPKRTKRAVGYTRVSTDEQRNEGQSIDNQAARIQAYAESQGWDLIDIYSDEGHSGKSIDRPELARLLADLETTEIDIVLVYKVDRLTRRQRDLWTLLEDNFEKNEVGFKSVSEPFDTTTATGKAFLSMIGTFAQLERDTIAERTADTLKHKKSNGEWIGRVPFGYRIGENGKLEKDPDEQRIIRRIRRMRSRGKTIREISRVTNTGRGTVFRVLNGHGNERNARYSN
ncbi:MAG: recombinase family protein [Candidatus Thorarchaeota archaeon]